MSTPSNGNSIPTPDFYSYPWMPIASARHVKPFVELRWADGAELSAYSWWLRESVVADGAVDPITREGTIDPAEFGNDLAVSEATVTADGALSVSFSDGFRGVMHPGWLHHVATGAHHVDAQLVNPTVWTAATLPAPPTFNGNAVLAGDSTELHSYVQAMVEFGLARLTNVPAFVGDEPARIEGLAAVADLIGVRRDTNFGDIWNVKAEITGNFENTTANTGFRLGPHTDLPTRETPPGYQFLHCVANSVSGGWSTMTDGAALVAHLKSEEPETYQALTTLNWIFFHRSRDHDHRWRGPMIDHGAPGSPLTLRAFYPVRAFPDMASEDVPRAYRAARQFHQLGADPRFQIRYPFSPGDLVGFDNRRILHGREAFDPCAGFRHLRGTYIDHDEIYSRLRVLSRNATNADGNAPAPTPTNITIETPTVFPEVAAK
jgi:gamma-butyrobetaine dioxygenase